MKPKKKENTKEKPFRKFCSSISSSFLDSKTFADKGSVDIQVLKAGKFRHPWWGVMKFDATFFEGMIKNFKADLPNPEIAFDFKHQPDFGAAAWVNKLFVENGDLMANVSMTARGKQSVKDKEFRYFSIEYTDDYTEYDFEDEEGEDGKVVEKETKISHGPTVLGGGLTNRPFIKGMLPVSLSEDGEMIELEEITEEGSSESNKEVNKSMKKTLEELQKAQKDLEAKIRELEDDSAKGTKEEMEALGVKLDTIAVEIKSFKDDAKKKKDDKKSKDDDAAALAADKKKKKDGDDASKLEEVNRQLTESNDTVKTLSDDVKTLSDTVKSLMKSNKVLNDDKHQLSLDKKLESLKGLGVFPATIKVIRNIAFSEGTKEFSITLSEGEGDTKKDVIKDFMDVIEDVFTSIPTEHRFVDTELSESPRTPTGSPKEASIEDVEKYAADNKVTFEEALVVFSKEGKIE